MLLIDGADLGAQRATNAADPSAGSDLGTKTYIDTGIALRMRYKAAWASGTAYAVNDVVTYNNGLYVCTTAISGSAASSVGTNKINSASAAGQNLPLPAGAATNDLLLLAHANYAGSSPTLPTGFTSVVTAANGNGKYAAAIKVLTSTDIANNYIAIPAQTASNNWAAVCEVFRDASGVDTSVAQTSTATTPAVTPTGAAFVVQVSWNLHDTTADGSMTQAAVSGFVTQGTPSGAFGACVGTGYDTVASGASTARTFTTAGNGATPDSAAIPILTTGFDATRWTYIGNADTNLPRAGSISGWAGSAAPTGYLLCDGTSYLRSAYPALFAVIGTNYGSADSTHFTVPDLRGRVPIGKDATTYTSLGQTGGATTHTHTLANAWAQITAAGSLIALARKVVASFNTSVQTTVTLAANTVAETSATALGGSTDSGDHTPPYQVINYIIKT